MPHCNGFAVLRTAKSYNLANYDRLRQCIIDGLRHAGQDARPLHDLPIAQPPLGRESPKVKLHQDPSQAALNTVTGYGPGYVEVNKVRYDHSVIIAPEGEVTPWAVSRFDALDASHFDKLRAREPEVVIFGSGERLRFAHPRLTTALTSQRVGVDSMDTQAACRTYNILMTEGRRVVLAVLIETEATE
ncbi:hypothetical protein PCO31010_04743 [Pandoraea commovens]|uniref:Xcc1710-like domain-containing protein n=1 Tax=Pandoraea commovens TaxID=2508289 RepID=A0A5E4YUX4_9BURK|nr:hypothetical protein PCO31010_04743 [Pandoraea commovens]